MTKYTVK